MGITTAQKRAIQKAIHRLNDGSAVFTFPTAHLGPATVDGTLAPVLDGARLTGDVSIPLSNADGFTGYVPAGATIVVGGQAYEVTVDVNALGSNLTVTIAAPGLIAPADDGDPVSFAPSSWTLDKVATITDFSKVAENAEQAITFGFEAASLDVTRNVLTGTTVERFDQDGAALDVGVIVRPERLPLKWRFFAGRAS
jgi:hypothetical protein